MFRDTDRLIEQLALEAVPVQPLAPPLQRTLGWLAVSMGVVAVLAVLFGWRGGMPEDMAVPGGGLAWWGSLLTGIVAAHAVFQVSVPGRSPGWAWLALLPALAWFGGMGWGCLVEARAGTLAFGLESWHCGLMITLVSTVMLLLVRHAGVLRPMPTAALAVLSAAGLSSAAVSLVHGQESAALTLIWHGGAVLLLCALAWLSGRPLLAWIGYARR
jgi:hypothetical protein